MEDKESVPTYCASQGLVHVVSFAEYTLCGQALEGENGDDQALDVVPQKIGCARCIEMIEFVKSIPNKYHRARKRRKARN